MLEEGSGTEPDAGADSISPAAAFVAGARRGRARDKADPEFDAFLRKQSRLIDLQTEHLHEQRELILSRLRWGRFSDRMRALLQAMTALVGLAVVLILAVMAWQAHGDRALVIEAFSVPPSMAQQGVTGEVVAGRLLDRLQEMQAATQSYRPAATYQDDWGSDIKVEIPETGVSFADLERLLRDRLGQTSRVEGDVIRTPTGIAVTARLVGQRAATFAGPETDLDALIGQAAEDLYRESQPFRYAEYLDQHRRLPEAVAVATDLAAHGPTSERPWAYGLLAGLDLERGDLPAARRDVGLGLAAGGDTLEVRIVRATVESWSGHAQAMLEFSRDLDRSAIDQSRGDISKAGFVENKLISTAYLAGQTGRYAAAADDYLKLSVLPGAGLSSHFYQEQAADELALNHDPRAAAGLLARAGSGADLAFYADEAKNGWYAAPAYQVAATRGDDATALARLREVDALIEAQKGDHPVLGLMQPVLIRPLQAQALAGLGRVAEAQALISTTPLDCYLCLRVRGQIAALRGDRAGSEGWFAQAVRQAPSIPFAYVDWAAARLARGDADGAIALLKRAHEIEPAFADALELWGEALMKKADYAGAAPKFADADKAAPKWGRNHLRWGEALMLSGRYAQARAQYETAQGLDLSPPDRAALNALRARAESSPIHG